MAVKIVRQSKKIALLGAATSAASLQAGPERAPSALRAAGLAQRLESAGFQVVLHSDTTTRLYEPDLEHPRAKNVSAILKSLNDLRPRVEVAVKSGALPVILSGDGISVLATIAGLRRYYRNVSLIYLARHAGLEVPSATRTGCVDDMVISHVVGRGAPELIRFWGEPPLIREADVAVFGFERTDDPGDEKFLMNSPLRRHTALEISTGGAAAAAQAALERVHAARHEFVLHFHVNVISNFRATNSAGSTGLTRQEVTDALRVFVRQPNLAAVEVSGYNPELDPDGEEARVLVELLAEVLASRLKLNAESAETSAVLSTATASAAPEAAVDGVAPSAQPPHPPEPEKDTADDPQRPSTENAIANSKDDLPSSSDSSDDSPSSDPPESDGA